MRERDYFRIDHFRVRTPEEELPAGDLAAARASGERPVRSRLFPLSVNSRCPLWAAARIATYAFASLLFAVMILAAPAASSAGVAIGVSVALAPPALPVYTQPPCPGPGYIWTPGYWSYDDGYYWVPGTWARPPYAGALWTPGYWGWNNGLYAWHVGYWGPVVGFYGGINYGFGYTGFGYAGGYWNHGAFFYNRAVNNVNITNITNVYNRTVVNNPAMRASYNGGPGGTTLRATEGQLAAARERHAPPTEAQMQHERTARLEPNQRLSANHGNPAVAATPRPGAFNGREVMPDRHGDYVNREAPAPRPTGRGQVQPGGTHRRIAPGQSVSSGPAGRSNGPWSGPSRLADRHGEPRFSPDRGVAARQPGAPNSGQQRSFALHQLPGNNGSRERDRAHY